MAEHLLGFHRSDVEAELAQLAAPITRFFTEILVMDENPETRYNRLGLCQSLAAWSRRHLDLRELVFPGE